MNDILLKSVLGGALIGAVLLITKFFGPKWGGIAAMVPLSFTLAYVLATYGAENEVQAKFLMGGATGWLGFGLFVLTLYLLLPFGLNFWLRLTIGYAVWFGFAFLSSFQS